MSADPFPPEVRHVAGLLAARASEAANRCWSCAPTRTEANVWRFDVHPIGGEFWTPLDQDVVLEALRPFGAANEGRGVVLAVDAAELLVRLGVWWRDAVQLELGEACK